MANLSNRELQVFNFKPAYNALFTIVCGDEKLNALASLQATGIKLPSETLNLERDKTTFKYKVRKEGSYQRINSVSITWREDEEYSVRKFHENWLREIYDPVLDAYRAGIKPGKLFEIHPYRSDGTLVEEAIITLRNAIPQKWGDLDFTWGDEPRGISYTITYYVEEIVRAEDPNVKMSGEEINIAKNDFAINPADYWEGASTALNAQGGLRAAKVDPKTYKYHSNQPAVLNPTGSQFASPDNLIYNVATGGQNVSNQITGHYEDVTDNFGNKTGEQFVWDNKPVYRGGSTKPAVSVKF